MPSDSPPSYQAAVGQQGQPGGPGRGPALNVTTPQGETRTASQDALGDTGAARRPGHSRSASDVSDISDVESDGGVSPGLLDEEGRRSMDDEQRELPEGWVRCWDPKNEHHFYVDTATKRSTWLHPYDDPEFLRTLPEHHPAHPNSAEATAMRKRGEDEALLVQKAQSHSSSGPGPSSPPKGSSAKGASATNPDGSHAWPQRDEHRNWIQRKKDQIIGTKEERAKAKEDRRKAKAEAQRKRREMEEQYLKRRQELMRQQLNDPNIRNYYASDPFSYSAPAGPYSRAGGLYASPYGYGYPGGYGRRYGYGYGSPYGYGGLGMGGLGMGGGMMLGGGAGLLGGMMLGDAMAGGF